MDKINIDKVKLESSNIADENFEKLASLFPNVVTETIINDRVARAIDIEKLKQEINAHILSENEERYNFSWPDKRKSVVLANAPTRNTLRACIKESKDFDNTENLYIEGDNLEVLKLLRNTYLGQVKMIYIDPPYNTGKDFVYKDNFFMSKEDYLENSGQVDENGNKYFPNTETNGRYHTDWLNMMYPRLKMARDLLTDEGAIFISIDDNEVSNLRKICDEIFGERNCIASIVIKSNPRGSMSKAEIAELHEYIVMYAKNKTLCTVLGIDKTEEMLNEYKFKDENGVYRLLGLRMRGGFWRKTDRPNLFYPIYVNPLTNTISVIPSESYTEVVYPIQPTTNEDGTWRWSKEKVNINSNLLVAKKINRNDKDIYDIYQKDYLNEKNKTKVRSIWDEKEVNYQNGADDIKNLFNRSGIFDYTKPVYLIKKIISFFCNDNDITIDFFSGSATTAHAVMQLNAEDGGGE